MAIKTINYKKHTFQLSYEMLNVEANKGILILHGWGSHKELMKQAFSKYLVGYWQIYLDLPGFGASSTDMALTTKDYASIVQLFMEATGRMPIAIMGHSFGGKVATLLKPDYLILLSTAGILLPKSLWARMKVRVRRLVKSLELNGLHQLIVAPDAKGLSDTMYETFQNVIQEDFEAIFADYKGQVLLFWGEDDRETPLHTGKSIATLMENSKLYLLDGGHYFFLEHGKSIVEEMIQVIESSPNREKRFFSKL
jgi:pimeloyl-ACP methyl ester carboxylesterase